MPSELMSEKLPDGLMMVIFAAGLLSTEQFREAVSPRAILRVSTVLINSGASENEKDEKENEGYIKKRNEMWRTGQASHIYNNGFEN